MFSTLGGIQTAVVGLLCSQIIVILSFCWAVARVRRLSKLVSRAIQRAKAPEKWESSLLEVRGDVASLSSEFEKVLKQLTRLNSRAGMREFRSIGTAEPPPGASKGALRKFYGLNGVGPEFARKQMAIEQGRDE